VIKTQIMSCVRLAQKAIDLKMVFAKHAAPYVLNVIRRSVLLALKDIEKMLASVFPVMILCLTVKHAMKKKFARSV
jgi:hypothetical protein